MNSLDKMEDYDRLKQERDELAAQVEVMRDAGNYVVSAIRERTFSGAQTLEVLENALSITPSAALREIQARTLDDMLDKFPYFSSEEGLWLADEIRVIAADIRKGEPT